MLCAITMSTSQYRPEDQARLVILFILCNKTVEEKLVHEFLALSAITETQRVAIYNLVNLHVPIKRSVRQKSYMHRVFFAGRLLSHRALFSIVFIIALQAAEPKSESAPFHDDETLKRNRKFAEDTQKLCR